MFLIARNTLRAILSRHAIYIWGVAVLLMLLRAAPAMFAEGDDAIRAVFRARAVTGALDTWAVLCIASAIFLGAGTIASEIASKTLITIIARPLARWEVVIGRWLGIVGFSMISLVLGLAIGLGIAAYAGIQIDQRALALAAADTAIAIALYGACSVALSGVGASSLAAALTVLLVFVPAILPLITEDPRPARRMIGAVIDGATPGGVQGHYDAIARLPEMPRSRAVKPIDYAAARAGLLENTAHTVVYLLLGCVFFSRRDIKL